MSDLLYRQATLEAYCSTCAAEPGTPCSTWPPHSARLQFLSDLHAEIARLSTPHTSPAPSATPRSGEATRAVHPGRGHGNPRAPVASPGARGDRKGLTT